MAHVRLETREGELVVSGRVPDFNTQPEVMLWGVRLFRFHETDKGVLVFREAFSTYLVDVD